MLRDEKDFLNYLKTGDMELTHRLGIPVVKGLRIKNLVEPDMLGFNYSTNPKVSDRNNKLVHFYLADGLFERVWSNPDKYIELFKQYKAIVAPDFSTYTDMPPAMQIWNHYRNMWLARYYQDKGIHVIASPSWSTEESFDYCFEGMPKNSLPCVSTVGCVMDKTAWKGFLKGFEHMLKVLTPSQLIIYGVAPPELYDRFPELIQVDSDQKRRMRSWREAK